LFVRAALTTRTTISQRAAAVLTTRNFLAEELQQLVNRLAACEISNLN
jgi:hypothetical protein